MLQLWNLIYHLLDNCIFHWSLLSEELHIPWRFVWNSSVVRLMTVRAKIRIKAVFSSNGCHNCLTSKLVGTARERTRLADQQNVATGTIMSALSDSARHFARTEIGYKKDMVSRLDIWFNSRSTSIKKIENIRAHFDIIQHRSLPYI